MSDENDSGLPASDPAPLEIGHGQGSQRWVLDGKALGGGDIVQVCCSGGWLTGRFEWSGTVDTPPRFFFSIELGGGKIDQHSIALPEGALLRRAR